MSLRLRSKGAKEDRHLCTNDKRNCYKLALKISPPERTFPLRAGALASEALVKEGSFTFEEEVF